MKVILQSSKKENNDRIFSLAWNIVYWLLKIHCFSVFRGWKRRSFLSQKVDGNMIFIDYWKVFVLNFLGMGNTVFFLRQKVNENTIFTDYWNVLVLGYRKFLFWAFRRWEKRSFFSQKADVNVIFTWSFLAFHDILGPGKYGLSCSVPSFPFRELKSFY